MPSLKDLTGQRFGRLIVIARHDRRNGIARWSCLCDCGTEKIIWQNSLSTGETVSCGCFQREESSRRIKERAVPAYDRALRYVEKIDGGCWEYQDRLDKHGYGRIDSSFVHRVFYQKLKGDIGGLCVLHKCDNPKCCNPDHLFLGTKADNTADMIAKGRMAVGEDLPHAKLTADKVREIRRKALAKTYVQKSERQTILALADEYGMSEHAIYQVIKRMNWKHVE